MSDRVRFFSTRDLDHSLRNQWTRDTRAEQILVLVNRAGLEHRENEIAREFLSQIFDDAFRRAGFQCFLLETGQFLFLTDVGAESDDLGLIIILQPAKNDRCIEAAGVCENDFHGSFMCDI